MLKLAHLLKTEVVNPRDSTYKKAIKKCLKFIKILTLISLKTVYKMLFTANILGMWEKRRGFTPHAGVLLPGEPVPQYIYIKLPKPDDNGRTHKNDANTLS